MWERSGHRSPRSRATARGERSEPGEGGRGIGAPPALEPGEMGPQATSAQPLLREAQVPGRRKTNKTRGSAERQNRRATKSSGSEDKTQ